MIKKTSSPVAAHTRDTFALPASLWADRIFVVGDFNHWQPHRTPLVQEQDGAWCATLDLPTGQHYHFRYLVDGEWRTDFHADSFVHAGEPTRFGNSIVVT